MNFVKEMLHNTLTLPEFDVVTLDPKWRWNWSDLDCNHLLRE